MSSARSGQSPRDFRNGFDRSQPTLDLMNRSYQNRLRDANDRQLTARVMSSIHDQQGRTRLGQKVITPADEGSDTDDDFIVMNTVNSIFDKDRQTPQVVIHEHHHYHDKKKKNKKKRSSSTSSSASSTESPESRKRKKERKKSRKEKKKGRKRELEESSANEGPSKRKKPAVVSDFDMKRNPWTLLRKNEWTYKPLNLVVDTHGDLANLNHNSSHRGDVPEYCSLNSEDDPFWRVFSEQFRGLVGEPANSTMNSREEQHCFTERVMKQWGKRAPERTFRNRANEKSFENYVKLSHAPCAENEAGAISLNPVKHELDEQLLGNINIEEYEHLMRSQHASYEEALESDVQARHSILQATVIKEPANVDAWLKLVDIQREMQAKNESGDTKAPVQNTKALFEKMEGVIKQALERKNVSSLNPRAVELHLKYLKIMEEHFGPQSAAVLEKWRGCEDRFVNSITMWRDNIRMRQNDRTVFDLKKMVLMGPPTSESRLPLIDRCITKLVAVKNGTSKTHKMLEGTEQFLVDLLVQRCHLQVVTGHIAKAVAVMQALAEFHFFRPEIENKFIPDTKPDLVQKKLKKSFKTFWCSGLPRIGEPAANGWFRFEMSDLDFLQPKDSEAEVLEQNWNAMQDEEKSLLVTCKGLGLPAVEVRRRLENFRTKWFWSPVHFKHDDQRLYEHEARIVSFEELEPLLFSFTDVKYAKDLIFKLLHIFGVPIPDVFMETQENVLRHFSRDFFSSNSPVSMELNGFDLFVEYFVTQLAESTLMDAPRIYTALITCVSNSALPKHKKYAALTKLIRTKIRKLKHYGKEVKLSLEVMLSLYLVAFEEMVKVKQEMGNNCEEDKTVTKQTEECDVCLAVLRNNLDKKQCALWAIGETEPANVDKRKERLFYLRFAVFLARQLPFSTDPRAIKSENCEIKGGKCGEVVANLYTKRKFLHSLFYHGRTEQVPLNAQTKGTAYKYFTRRLIYPAAVHLDDPLRWIGDENELVFELCSYYAYEFPIQGIPTQRFTAFVFDESPLYGSGLAKLLGDRPCVQETRVLILRHIRATSAHYIPGGLRRKLSDLALRFPHNIPILRALLSVGNNFYKRQFLTQFSGTDPRSRLIRTCARIFFAYNHYTKEVHRYEDLKYDDPAFHALLAQHVHILRRVAEENCCDNSLPDDFIWTFLMNIITVNREMVSSSIIDEIFTLGQGRCPWSKQFLMESLRCCCESSDSSVTTVNATMKTHGLSSFCSDSEVQQLLLEAH
ncbi:hypothetical protein GPALN_010595 [Globodera pallida]|nr:hypothetical protein GPALN_010595 [Globodera pallida]